MGLTSLFAAVSGLNAFGNALSVTGNNIANLSTVGYKSQKATFSDLVTSSLGGSSGSNQIGRGVFTGAVLSQYTQGSLSTSGNGLDMAVDGNGFFRVRNSDNAVFYTRAGQFRVDKDGKVVDPNGNFLQGYQANTSGVISGTLSDITLSNAISSPQATSTASVVANLNASATAPSSAFSDSDPSTYNFSTSLTVYDSLGSSHTLNLYFRKTASSSWQMYHRLDGTTGTTDGAAQPTTLTFNSSGAMTSPAAALDIDYTAAQVGNGAAASSIALTITSITQFGAPNSVSAITQNGFASGSIAGTSIDTSGVITGRFTNGQVRTLAQVALSRFTNPDGLSRSGKNLLAETNASGQPTTSAPNTGGTGRVLSGSLELSNVDLGEEFIDMISAQRGFQANSRVITTTDDLLQELVNLRR
jgi:flagellar hook protein FlgE